MWTTSVQSRHSAMRKQMTMASAGAIGEEIDGQSGYTYQKQLNTMLNRRRINPSLFSSIDEDSDIVHFMNKGTND